MKNILGDFNPWRFYSIFGIFVSFIILGLLFPDGLNSVFISIRKFTIAYFGWAIVSEYIFMLFLALAILISPWGKLKLGKIDDKPEFSFISWVAMMYCCCLGIGVMFYAVAEPLYHMFQSPAVIANGEVGTAAALSSSINIAIQHWGLQAFTIFALGGLAIGLPAYRLNKPLVISTSLYGILGEKANTSLLGRIADGMGTIGAIGGVATMLGFGSASIGFAIQKLWGIDIGTSGRIVFILFLVLVCTISARLGLNKGTKILSDTNTVLAALLVIVVFFIGQAPIGFYGDILPGVFTETFSVTSNFLEWSFFGTEDEQGWLAGWTVFYFLWATSYLPFSAGFFARVSKGRTLREYILGVIIVPSLFITTWFGIWGIEASYLELNGILPIWETVKSSPESAMYLLLDNYPLGWWLTFIAFITICLYAITTADAAGLFAAMQTSESPNPTLGMRATWSLTIGLTGIIFMMSGGLAAIQSLTVAVGFPFFFISLLMFASLIIMLEKARKGTLCELPGIVDCSEIPNTKSLQVNN